MQFLERKLSVPPPPPFLVPRPQLLARLDEWIRRNLTLILAPAGSGKTTLLCEWAARREGKARVVWVSLGREDNDPYRFWQYIVAAIKPMANKLLAGWLQNSMDPTVEEMEQLINWIHRHVRQDFLLVLDDYHAITSPEINDSVAYLLDYLPPNMHIAIVSRSQPPLPIAQMRVRNQLLEFTREDLKFSYEEVGLFLNLFGLRNLLPEEIERLASRTEGWAVGLQIAAISLRDSDSAASRELLGRFSGTHHFLDEYFLEQIFKNQSPEVQKFLLSTSILERFNASLCSALTGRPDGRKILDQLECDSLFLVRLDNTREWYRYHQLFADFLANKLRQDCADRYAPLHKLAAEWYEAAGQYETAMEHALVADETDLADRIIQKVEEKLWGRNEIKTLERWFSTLPADYVKSKPSLYCGVAWTIALSGDLQQLMPYVVRLEADQANLSNGSNQSVGDTSLVEGLAQTHCSAVTFQCYSSLLRAYQALYQGRLQEAWPFLKHALELFSEDDLCWERTVVLYYTGQYLFWNYELKEAVKVFSTAAQMSQTLGHHIVHVSSLSGIAATYGVLGNLSLAEQYYQRSFEYLANIGGEIYTAGNHFGLNDVRLLKNQVDDAAKDTDHYFRLSEVSGRTVDLIVAHLGFSKLKQVLGNVKEAQVHLRKAHQLAVHRNVYLYEELVRLWQARLGLRIGDSAAAARWADHYLDGSRMKVPYLNELEDLTFVRYLLMEARGREALQLLEPIIKEARAGGRNGIVLEAMALRALAYQECGSQDQARATLEELIHEAQPEGFIRLFVDEGDKMETLLQGVLKRNQRLRDDRSMRRYIDQVLSAFKKPAGHGARNFSLLDRSKYGSNIKQEPPVEALSAREIQVLNLIAEGKSYEQVAGELVVAVSTVQWHVKNIYRKLHAHSGVEAVAFARGLGILQ